MYNHAIKLSSFSSPQSKNILAVILLSFDDDDDGTSLNSSSKDLEIVSSSS